MLFCRFNVECFTLVSYVKLTTNASFTNTHSHHDYIPFHTKRQCGVRVLTLFLYLNDVQKGGGTHFDELDITVEPKAGKAVLWPSVLDERPNEMDARTYHQALPVEEGFKFGANAWLHQRDFKAALDMGCV